MTRKLLDAWRATLESGSLKALSVKERVEKHRRFFSEWDAASLGPAPAWLPSETDIANCNLASLIDRCKVESLESLQGLWGSSPNEFWQHAIDDLGIRFKSAPTSVLVFDDPRSPEWLVGAELNIVDSCFQADPGAVALRFGGANRKIQAMTYRELLAAVQTLSGQLDASGFVPGDRLAIAMPMTAQSVVIYLAILHSGCAAVSIADSFAAVEIAKRLKIAEAKAIFFAESFERAGKTIELGITVREAVELRKSDGHAVRLLPTNHSFPNAAREQMSRSASPSETINILFSSGTTGDPKAIPWDHTTPIKCAADGKYLQDIKPGDIVVWPTNLGWMMGPWLIFATLINKATIGLYEDAPTGDGFGQFVQATKTTMLGVVPALVRHWKQTACMESCDWSSIRCFSSTGEASNPTDMTYLSSLAGFKPIIEYCGGTEVGGGYIASTMLQPNIPAAFSSPGIGSSFEIVNDAGATADEGELYLIPPTIGLSRHLLNRDHFQTYYADVPKTESQAFLRRHGDRMQCLPNGYWRACGRMDDTMNPGGIKIGSAEVEAIINSLAGVQESAVIATALTGDGPDELVAFVVAESALDEQAFKKEINVSIRKRLNPLIRIAKLQLVESLPRTASNKIMRRELRDQLR